MVVSAGGERSWTVLAEAGCDAQSLQEAKLADLFIPCVHDPQLAIDMLRNGTENFYKINCIQMVQHSTGIYFSREVTTYKCDLCCK